MALSLNALQLIWLLLPGFAFAVSWVRANPSLAVRPPPATSSLYILAGVPIGALLAHLLTALLLECGKYVKSRWGGISVDFDPNYYPRLFGPPANWTPQSGELLHTMFWILVSVGIGFLIPRARDLPPVRSLRRLAGIISAKLDVGWRKFRGKSPPSNDVSAPRRKSGEHWVDYLIRLAEPADKFLVAHVTTDREVEVSGQGSWRLGYSGVVESIRLDGDGNPLEVTIDDAEPILTGPTGEMLPSYQPNERRIRFLTFQAAHIFSLSLEVLPPYEPSSEGGVDEDALDTELQQEPDADVPDAELDQSEDGDQTEPAVDDGPEQVADDEEAVDGDDNDPPVQAGG